MIKKEIETHICCDEEKFHRIKKALMKNKNYAANCY